MQRLIVFLPFAMFAHVLPRYTEQALPDFLIADARVDIGAQEFQQLESAVIIELGAAPAKCTAGEATRPVSSATDRP